MKVKRCLVAALCAATLIPVFAVSGCKKDKAGEESAFTVELDKSEMTVSIGTPGKLFFSVTPSETPVSYYSWWNDDVDVATVSSEGLVTGVKTGVTTVTVTVNGKVKDSCLVTVVDFNVKMSKSADTLYVGDSGKLAFTLEPAETEIGSALWRSADPAVASVSSDGTVTALNEGVSKVTVTVNGLVTDSCTVNVKGVDDMENFGSEDADEWFK